ncbi:hypothetical protein J1N10_02340 [Carboxylicivirga sp. A043]|uniref:hypothetical protein n=1 Tax=Carboxylicivirga litoralis TaxID=2816963 RepID=UPI0021CB9346|nr:hypothetical protein [Carboxylicivirga sp. A043]MCU4154796.1 hypothetical protein [Carboxylicivirga sp. A043]
MNKQIQQCCQKVSDKDFIFDLFSNTGFVANASSYLQNDQNNNCCDDCEESEPRNTTEPKLRSI